MAVARGYAAVVTSDAKRGVYALDTGMARLAGNVQITRGQNQLNGAEADVNMKTGIATLVSTQSARVHGLVVPNDTGTKSLGAPPDQRQSSAPPSPPAVKPPGATAGRNP